MNKVEQVQKDAIAKLISQSVELSEMHPEKEKDIQKAMPKLRNRIKEDKTFAKIYHDSIKLPSLKVLMKI